MTKPQVLGRAMAQSFARVLSRGEIPENRLTFAAPFC